MGLPVLAGGLAGLEAKLAYADKLSRADMLPDAYRGKPGNVLLAIEYGQMLGVHPLTAIQHVHVINGRLGLSSELMRGKVRSAGHRLRVTENTPTSATVELTTADDPGHMTCVVYTMDDARTAGALDIWWEHWTTNENGRKRKQTWTLPPALANKVPAPSELAAAGAPDWVLADGPGAAKRNENWWRHPAAMLVARASSTTIRAACPEVVMGMDCADDFNEEPDELDDQAAIGELVVDEGPDEPPISADPASPDQLDRIAELAQLLTPDQSAAATRWREERGYDWQRLDSDSAGWIIAYLESVTAAAVAG